MHFYIYWAFHYHFSAQSWSGNSPLPRKTGRPSDKDFSQGVSALLLYCLIMYSGEICYLSWEGPSWKGMLSPCFLSRDNSDSTPFPKPGADGLMKERSPSVWGINIYAQILTRFQTAKDLWIEEFTCVQNVIDFILFLGSYFKLESFVLFVLKIILWDVFHLHQEPDLYELCQQPSLMSGFHLSSSNGASWVTLGGGRRVGSGCLFPSPSLSPPPHIPSLWLTAEGPSSCQWSLWLYLSLGFQLPCASPFRMKQGTIGGALHPACPSVNSSFMKQFSHHPCGVRNYLCEDPAWCIYLTGYLQKLQRRKVTCAFL